MQQGLFLICLLLLSGITNTVSAEVYTYTDSYGQKHYVTSLEQVPQRYRSRIKSPAQLPLISSHPDPNYNPRKVTRVQKPVVLVMQGCPYCTAVERLFEKNDISYTRYDIKTDRKGRMLHTQWGGGGVPITKIGSTIVRGYDPTSILQALGK